jgi:ribosomal protein S18 acetylase RimI-like enzyme
VSSVRIAPLSLDLDDDARVIAARAFTNEPFMVDLAGDEPADRLAMAIAYWRGHVWDEAVRLGAFVGDVLVGICLCSLGGACPICMRTDLDGDSPADEDELMDWTFAHNARVLHAEQGAHDRLTLVAVDPVVQGAGIGTALVGAGLDALRASRVVTVVLECEPKRAGLYNRSGFTEVGTFFDPSSNDDALVMRATLA